MATYQASREERFFELSYAAFTSSFEALLGRIDVTVFTEIGRLGSEAARAKLASAVGPLEFAL
jgi:hypothetical protein